MTGCPSDLELEGYLLDPPHSRLEPHVRACVRCREQVREMRRLGDEFRREVFPATVGAVVELSRRRRRPWLLAAVPLSAAAAAALVLLLARPPPDHVGVKGGSLGLTVFVKGADRVRAAGEGEPVPAGAAIRFEVRSPRACRLWIVSADGAGQVSRIFPALGDAAAGVETDVVLPGGAVLDGRPGPERIFAVCSPGPLRYADVERAARAVAGGGDASVRSAGGLAGLPRGSAQATVLLEKRP